MQQEPFPPPPGTPVETDDGTEVDMFPVLYQGQFLAFAWRPNAETALELYSAESPSLLMN